MKALHFINIVAIYITLGLYLFIFLGMLAQTILGPLQLILAGVITFRYYKLLDQHHQILMLYYWFAASIGAVIATITLYGSFGEMSKIFGVYVLPMCIACYFLYVTKNLNRHLSSSKELQP